MDARMDAQTSAAARPLTRGDLNRAKIMILEEIKSLSKMVTDRVMTHLSRTEELYRTAPAAGNLQVSQLAQTSTFLDPEPVRTGLSMDGLHTSCPQLEAAHKKRPGVPIHVPALLRPPLMTCDDLEELLAQRLAHDPLLPLRWEQELQARLLAQTPTPGSTPLHSTGASPSITPISTSPPSPLLGLCRSMSTHICFSNADVDAAAPFAVRGLPGGSVLSQPSRGVSGWEAISDFNATCLSGPGPLSTGTAIAPSSLSGVRTSSGVTIPAGLEIPGFPGPRRYLPTDGTLSPSSCQRNLNESIPHEAAVTTDGSMDHFGGGRQEIYEELSRFTHPSSSCWSQSSSAGSAERDALYADTWGFRPQSMKSNISAATAAAGEAVAAAANEVVGPRRELPQGLVQEILRQLAMVQSSGGTSAVYKASGTAPGRIVAGAGGIATEVCSGGQSSSRIPRPASAESGPDREVHRNVAAAGDLGHRTQPPTLPVTSSRSASATPVYNPGFLPDRQPRQRQQPSPQQQQQQQQQPGQCISNSGKPTNCLLASSSSSSFSHSEARISSGEGRSADANTFAAGRHLDGRPAAGCSASTSSSSSFATLPGSSAGNPSLTGSPLDSNTGAIASGLLSSSQHLAMSPAFCSSCRESYSCLSYGQPDL
ncbi:hypothetical protein VaNZ11_012242 [Volvox africanus]|uniref:Uncharacterized protein n=1 Tax=Volvox africanus TaxID=51714 RepID=A0ABQ5SDD7_9CHLO|nr:hypothetical protein VaNZ11_012242 [Volvox africanus]